MPKRTDLTPERIIKALKETSGLVYLAADKLGCHFTTVYKWGRKYKEIRGVLDQLKGKRHDTAEAALWNAVLKGEAWAICFYLKTQCKHRGYIERVEQRTVKDEELDDAIERELEALAKGRQGQVPGKAKGAGSNGRK